MERIGIDEIIEGLKGMLEEIDLTIKTFEEKMASMNNKVAKETLEIRNKLTDEEFGLLATSIVASHQLVLRKLNNIKAEERGH